MSRPVVLSIAGFDPSSGAGATADLKTIAAHHCYGVSCLTALTIQSTQGVMAVEPLDPGVVAKTLACLAEDFEFQAVKIGMLGAGNVANTVAQFLEQLRPPHLVVDPVLISSSGKALIDDFGRRTLVERLFPLAEVITPNLAEAEELTRTLPKGTETQSKAALDRYWNMAEALINIKAGPGNVVITGGDREPPTDLLLTAGGEKTEFPGRFVHTRHTHGTGCAFSSAIACNLALGFTVQQAVSKAKDYVTRGLMTAYSVGKGTGPLNHFPEGEP